MHATQWMGMYNHERPNMALVGITPKQRLAMTAVALLLSPVLIGVLPNGHS
jgi:hypothetical protein